MKQKILSPETKTVLSQFAEKLATRFQKAEPARFFNSRGVLLYVKIDCDPAEEVKELLESFLEE